MPQISHHTHVHQGPNGELTVTEPQPLDPQQIVEQSDYIPPAEDPTEPEVTDPADPDYVEPAQGATKPGGLI